MLEWWAPMYRLLALDLDGTLLRRDGVVDDRDIAAIAELQAAGVVVTIVTGRLHSGATFAARACRIDGAIVCVDGSHLGARGPPPTPPPPRPAPAASSARGRCQIDRACVRGRRPPAGPPAPRPPPPTPGRAGCPPRPCRRA